MADFITKLRGLIIEQVVSRPDPQARARARRYGLNNIRRKPPTLELYFEPGDPHSHIALQALGQFADRLHCPIAVFVVPAPEESLYPEADKQRAFALSDTQRIAAAWGLNFPQAAKLAASDVAHKANQAFVTAGKDLYKLLQLEARLRPTLFEQADWPDEITELESHSRTQAELDKNACRREKLGHYLPAMWQFDGEWFWSVDRLDFLKQRLIRWGALEDDAPLLQFNAAKAELPTVTDKTLTFYFSFRSPYSYLAAEYVLAKHESWPVSVDVKPVLPMVMRGLPVPSAKRLYIARDVKRCADRDGIPFGRIADPVGAGAERALTVFSLCQGTQQQLQFLAAAGRAAFAEHTDLATDAGMLYTTRQAGLDDDAVLAKLAKGIDLTLAERNRQDLFDHGLWGVPSWRLGEVNTWGYDRRWMLEEWLKTLA